MRTRRYLSNQLDIVRMHNQKIFMLGGALTTVMCLFIFTVGYLLFSFYPPHDFPQGVTIEVPKGSYQSVVESLYKNDLIRSAMMARVYGKISGAEKSIDAGLYHFSRPLSLREILSRLSNGERDLEVVAVTFPEGTSVDEMGKVLAGRVPLFDVEKFIELGKPFEGYLFPDTYQITPDTRPEELIDIMRETFQRKTTSLASYITKSGKSLEEIVKMASILEKEARLLETRQMISGILWLRIAKDMPLQVDVSFGYINGKNTTTLTLDDLKVDSLYNSYKYKGLPPTPITNPGYESLLAAATPTKTTYLYFLTDNNGVMRYANTHETHVFNKDQYLR